MVKIPKNERLFPGDEICVIRMHMHKEFKTYLHQHEFEALKILKKRKLHCNNWN
jgi:hypothetical protein